MNESLSVSLAPSQEQKVADAAVAKAGVNRPAGRSLSRLEMMALQKFPCDGIPRYSVSGVSNDRVTYAAAYEGLLAVTKCTRSAGGAINFSPDGLRRIRAMNKIYLRTSANFVKDVMHRENQAAFAAINSASHKTENEAETAVGVPSPAAEKINVGEVFAANEHLFDEGKITINELRAKAGLPRVEGEYVDTLMVSVPSTEAPVQATD